MDKPISDIPGMGEEMMPEEVEMVLLAEAQAAWSRRALTTMALLVVDKTPPSAVAAQE